MPQIDTSVATTDQPKSGICLVSAADLALGYPTLLSASWLPVDLPIPGPAERGRFATIVDDAIENALTARGSLPAGLSATQDLESTLSDQLDRAHQVGFSGLCLIVPPLHGMTNAAGVLDVEDSAALRWWLSATTARPLALWVDDANRYLGVYGPPTPLHRLMGRDAEETPIDDGVTSERALRVPKPSQHSHSAETMPLGVGPRHTSADERAMAPGASSTTTAIGPRNRGTELAPVAPTPSSTPTREPSERAETSESPRDDVGESADQAEDFEASSCPAGAAPQAAAAASGDAEGPPRRSPPSTGEDSAEASGVHLAPAPSPDQADRPSTPTPLYPQAAEEWGRWLKELDEARGPKPLSVVERLFTSAYCPLVEAIARGIAPQTAVGVARRWASSFEQSYAEAFDALRLRGRRPAMVLDIPDVALRAARLHGARAVQLILVDAMRFDLGVRVHRCLERVVGDGAMLTERHLTWSALPSTTSAQLELIGRGVDGLRERGVGLASDVSVARGRAAQTLRRVKAGPRELLKLDIVESNLCDRGPALLERLDSLAAAVAEPVGNYLLQLPPRTLVMVFGDHGFVVDSDQHGTTAGRHGGASPDEVLVPAFAWLTGAMH